MIKKIVVIANPSIPLPPVNYGGAERIVDFINIALEAKGHKLSIIAAKGSKRYGGKLYHYFPSGNTMFKRIFERLRFYLISLIALRSADLIINHGRVDYLFFFFLFKKKIINVFHNPISQFEIDYLHNRSKLVYLVGLSRNHIEHLTRKELFYIVNNGTNTNLLNFDSTSSREYYVFLGRMTRLKGIDRAIRICIKMNVILKIAGPIPPKDSDDYLFYVREVLPYLNSSSIVYVGNISDVQKNELFAGAIASLFPLVGPEAFGLNVIESLACGVPVITSNSCAMPELIEQGKTGFLCDTDEDYYSAIKQINSLNNTYCRSVAEDRFSMERMSSEYIELTDAILN